MVTVWWFSAGLIHHSFTKSGETIAVEKYCREINDMYQELALKQAALVNKKSSIFLQYNARRYVLMIIRQKLHTKL